MKRIAFDANTFINVILGITWNSEHSCCWENNDYKLTTKESQLMKEREGKDYNSFGKTKKIDF